MTLAKGHSAFKLSLFFSKPVWSFASKFQEKTYWITGLKIHTNNLGHMTKMADTALYDKTLSKNFLL